MLRALARAAPTAVGRRVSRARDHERLPAGASPRQPDARRAGPALRARCARAPHSPPRQCRPAPPSLGLSHVRYALCTGCSLPCACRAPLRHVHSRLLCRAHRCCCRRRGREHHSERGPRPTRRRQRWRRERETRLC